MSIFNDPLYNSMINNFTTLVLMSHALRFVFFIVALKSCCKLEVGGESSALGED